MTKEMKILREYLDDNKISHIDNINDGRHPITQTYFEYNNKAWSVIHGFGTYGGYDNVHEDMGLLEVYDFSDNPIGYLTAQDVINLIFGGEEYNEKEVKQYGSNN